MRDFLVVCMLAPIEVGTQFTQWPLHMTLVPWFKASDEKTVQEIVQNATSVHHPFSVTIGERAYFGPAGKLPVLKIVNTPDLQSLHESVLQAVKDAGLQIEGRYTGDNYSPHVTQQAGKDAEGVLQFDCVYIAEALPQGYRKIVAKLELGK
jgi:2'-5' RNA ligase